jgi:hypothetical protein
LKAFRTCPNADQFKGQRKRALDSHLLSERILTRQINSDVNSAALHLHRLFAAFLAASPPGIAEFERYESELSRIYTSFNHTRDGIHIGEGDDPLYRQYVRELIDLYNDTLGSNAYSAQIAHEFNSGFGYMGPPSLKGVENVLGVVRASLTRLHRNPDLLIKRKAEECFAKKRMFSSYMAVMKPNGESSRT